MQQTLIVLIYYVSQRMDLTRSCQPLGIELSLIELVARDLRGRSNKDQ